MGFCPYLNYWGARAPAAPRIYAYAYTSTTITIRLLLLQYYPEFLISYLAVGYL